MSVEGMSDPSRRRFMSAALAVLLAGGALGGCSAWPLADLGAGLSAEQLAALLGDRAAAARLGEAYLRDHPSERDLDTLLQRMGSALRDQGAPGATLSNLDRVVRGEYRRGDVVRVQGWLLSRSEARLYAAASLL